MNQAKLLKIETATTIVLAITFLILLVSGQGISQLVVGSIKSFSSQEFHSSYFEFIKIYITQNFPF